MKSKLIKLLSGYEEVEGLDVAGSRVSSKRHFKRKLSGSISSRAGSGGAGKLIRFSYAVFNIASYTAARAYGAFLLTFGILTLLLNSGADLLVVKLPTDTTSLIIGAVFAVISIPFFFLEGPLSPALEKHKLTNELFYEFFCIKRPSKLSGEVGVPLVVCISAGIVFAAIGAWLSVFAVLFILIGAVYGYLAFVSPEFSLFSCILILPSVSVFPAHDYIASFVAFIMLLSFLRKVAFGKRSYNFEQYDVILCLMMLIIILSGIFVGGHSSLNLALVIFFSTFVYFATGNLITNPRLVDCMVRSIILSSIIPCITGVVQFVINAVTLGLRSAFLLGVSSTFTSADAFAAYLIVPICFSFMFAREKRSPFFWTVFAFDCTALVISGNHLAIIALLFAVSCYALMHSHKLGFIPMLLLIALPYAALYFARYPAFARFMTFIIGDSLYETLEIWQASLGLLRDNLLLGVGISSEEFFITMKELLSYGVYDSRNIFIDMAAKSGIITVVLFVCLLLSRLRHRIAYRRFLEESSVGRLSATASITVIAMLVFGSFGAVFAEISLYYIFFSVFAIGSATLRIACEEHDDRITYFKDARRTYSAAVDLDLR